jgi:hypothetical protein
MDYSCIFSMPKRLAELKLKSGSGRNEMQNWPTK